MTNIVVCCDGTGNGYGDNNTNVVKMYERIVRNEGQIANYDPGVGTFSVFGRILGKKVGLFIGKAFGYGITENIEDAYCYLMDRYQRGDKVFLFGFSRGAYTARALAGMLHKVGLLQKGSVNLIPYASDIYNTRDNDQIAAGFKETYCQECKPHFIGVWDTVGSLGWVYSKRKFFNTRLNKDVTHGYQAISIDEKRKKFPISVWEEEKLEPGQNVVQVWFAGVHSDVGGWYDERDLSDIALIWMLENADLKGLKLKDGWKEKLKPNPLGEIHESRTKFWRVWRPAIRKIPKGAKIHTSVLTRMEANKGYKPRLPDNHSEAD